MKISSHPKNAFWGSQNLDASDLKWQSASEIATEIALRLVQKTVEIATEIAVIRIAAIPNR